MFKKFSQATLTTYPSIDWCGVSINDFVSTKFDINLDWKVSFDRKTSIWEFISNQLKQNTYIYCYGNNQLNFNKKKKTMRSQTFWKAREMCKHSNMSEFEIHINQMQIFFNEIISSNAFGISWANNEKHNPHAVECKHFNKSARTMIFFSTQW